MKFMYHYIYVISVTLLCFIITNGSYAAVPDANRFVVKVADDKLESVIETAKSRGFNYLKQVGKLHGYHIFTRTDTVNDTKLLEDITHIEWSKFETSFIRRKRQTDPLFSVQWHLQPVYRDPVNPHLNVVPVWNSKIDGKGITVSVVDDGVQWTHPDFNGGFSMQYSQDFGSGQNDPSPSGNDYHGTAVAGIVGARINNVCGVGVAPGCTLVGAKIRLDGGLTDSMEAEALSHSCRDHIDVYTNSWGPQDDGQRLEGPGHITTEAMLNCIKTGRHGKGSIFVWAGGNGRANMDDVNYDGYANSIYTIAVGAVTEKGTFAWYSERGACLLVSAPSSGGSKGISTTDLRGFPGRTSGDCNKDFGGTSAAAPMIAGVVALMLQANSKLTWRDVQHILIHSCYQINSDLKDGYDRWTKNDAGLLHSHAYGFGIPDTVKAVDLSKSWVNKPEKAIIVGSKDSRDNQHYVISINAGSKATSTYTFKNSTTLFNTCLEHVELYIQLNAPQGRGRVSIDLESPYGTLSHLQRPHLDTKTDLEWIYTSVRYWNESPVGKWSLVVANTARYNTHMIKPVVVGSWKLILHTYPCK